MEELLEVAFENYYALTDDSAGGIVSGGGPTAAAYRPTALQVRGGGRGRGNLMDFRGGGSGDFFHWSAHSQLLHIPAHNH